jgi:hypothetical protein
LPLLWSSSRATLKGRCRSFEGLRGNGPWQRRSYDRRVAVVVVVSRATLKGRCRSFEGLRGNGPWERRSYDRRVAVVVVVSRVTLKGRCRSFEGLPVWVSSPLSLRTFRARGQHEMAPARLAGLLLPSSSSSSLFFFFYRAAVQQTKATGCSPEQRDGELPVESGPPQFLCRFSG